MATSQSSATQDVAQMVLEETDRRLDTYYELALPGEHDSPIEPMEMGSNWAIMIVAAALLVLWLVGRFVVLPMFI